MRDGSPAAPTPEALLCDADGCLFPSEGPAFDASERVTNEALAHAGASARYDAEWLRLNTTGRTFRTTIQELLGREGLALAPEELEEWVERERLRVTEHLAEVLRPDPAVTDPLASLAQSMRLAVVTSSASERLNACLDATGLAELFPPSARFSAESSLPSPRSKPDPAVYEHALRQLGITADAALAVEDSPSGAQAAVAAGIPTVGNLQFVPAAELKVRELELAEAGVARCIAGWADLKAREPAPCT